MSFGAPALLALLALVPLVGLAYLYLARWRRLARGRFAPARPAEQATASVTSGLRALKAALILAAVALLALAAARPRIGQQELVLQQAGVDLVIALDVSESMLARDATPSRLERAQAEVSALLDRLRGDRVGLVLFARSAALRSPLTSDMTALRSLVERAAGERGLVLPGSDLGEAIAAARQALAAGEAESQAILLVSDGEDHGGTAVEGARAATREGIVVHTAGVGTPEGTFIPLAVPGSGQTLPKTDPATGQPIITRANEVLLRRLADAGGGSFVSLAGAEPRLPGLAAELRQLPQTLLATETEERPIERFQLFLLAALALLALEMVVPERRRERGARPAVRRRALLPPLLLALTLAVACRPAAVDFNRDGNDLYEQGSYGEALESYRRAEALQPDRAEFPYNAANALHRLERFEEAVAEALRALPVEDAALAARVHYNLGNHQFRLGRFAEAVDSYKQALLLDPDDLDAKYNLEVAQRMLALQAVSEAEGGEGQPPPGAQPSPGAPGEGTPGPALPGGAAPPSGEAGAQERLQRKISEALAGIDEEFTIDEALRALDLLRERGAQRPGEAEAGQGQPGGTPDY